MCEIKFRTLRPDEIQCRVKSIDEEKGTGRRYVSILLYKDARVDQNILDETVGPERWSKDYKEVNGLTYCRVGIKTESGEWVYKEDTGSDDSNFEREKALASDSFKRAGFAWGIGRALYNSPKILCYVSESEIKWNPAANRDVLAAGVKFFVKSISYDDTARNIISLTIVDQAGNVRFVYPRK